MQLWVTRAEPDASRQAAKLQERGHQAIVEPLLDIRFDDSVPLSLTGIQALIATSRNGLRALERRPELAPATALPVFVVGPASADLARSLGFSSVVEGPGTGDGLIEIVARGCDSERGPLLHLAGKTLASDLKGGLEMHGFTIIQPALYEAVRVTALSAELHAALAGNCVDGVILMSPRTAKVYMTVIREGGLVEVAHRLHHYCLSEAVADRLAPLDSRRLSVAARPREPDLLMLLDGRRAD